MAAFPQVDIEMRIALKAKLDSAVGALHGLAKRTCPCCLTKPIAMTLMEGALPAIALVAPVRLFTEIERPVVIGH